jgi:dinuclear metal center YbgI/SA1388 family protein
MKLETLIKFLDEYLDINGYKDADISLNGLQVGGFDHDIKHIVFAVDASQNVIDKLVEKNNADLLIVHHGLFWGKPLAITGAHRNKIESLLNCELNLYAAHLPLDANMKCGHNVTMARRLSLQNIKPSFAYHNISVGVVGELIEPLTVKEISDILEFTNPIIMDFNDGPITKIGIVSGEGAHDVREAKALGCDLLITGEPRHSEYHWCEEEKIAMLCGGHYETEVFGLQSLASLLVKTFDIAISFVNDPTGL